VQSVSHSRNIDITGHPPLDCGGIQVPATTTTSTHLYSLYTDTHTITEKENKNTHKNKLVEPENCKNFYLDIVEMWLQNIMPNFHGVVFKLRNTELLGSRLLFESRLWI